MSVWVDPGILQYRTPADKLFDLLTAVSHRGQKRSWEVRVTAQFRSTVPYRVCMLRKSGAAVRLAHRGIRRESFGKGRTLAPQI